MRRSQVCEVVGKMEFWFEMVVVHDNECDTDVGCECVTSCDGGAGIQLSDGVTLRAE